jgi:5-deoxy-glucuronate isomerase
MAELLRRPARVVPDGQAWRHVRFEVQRLGAGAQMQGSSGEDETALLVLAGSADITAGGQRFSDVGGRPNVWARRPPSWLLLPPGCAYQIDAQDDVELAIASARATSSGGRPRLVGLDEAIVEHRGAGQTARLVHHLLPPSAEAERLIIVEVYTPGGNWSSFPPHKHDTDDPPHESQLDELYYYHVDPPSGFAVQRVYTADGSLDQSLAARDGDLVLVPRGYHVVGATPGHDCYYLNVMAGQGRVWAFSLDPAYAHLMNWTKPPGT